MFENFVDLSLPLILGKICPKVTVRSMKWETVVVL